MPCINPGVVYFFVSLSTFRTHDFDQRVAYDEAFCLETFAQLTEFLNCCIQKQEVAALECLHKAGLPIKPTQVFQTETSGTKITKCLKMFQHYYDQMVSWSCKVVQKPHTLNNCILQPLYRWKKAYASLEPSPFA